MEPAILLAQLRARKDLTTADSRALFDAIMAGRFEAEFLSDLLTAWADKGETADELVGAALALRARATPIRIPPGVNAIDTCGTGGDGQPIFNVSTCVAIVAAAAGATVAKHGNRSNARPSGSAEVLEALGVDTEADVPTVERCLEQCRVGFLYARRLHPAMKQVADVRRALRRRTIFNLVGPLTNPAGVRRQLIGVNRPELVETMSAALQQLGAERALVVHGRADLCDLSLAGPSRLARLDGPRVSFEEVECATCGVRPAALTSLCVTSPQQSAALIREVLDGRPGAAREIVVFNAAAALWVAGLVEDWSGGAQLAREVLDRSAARATLDAWVATAHSGT